jgi:hypothetical protein
VPDLSGGQFGPQAPRRVTHYRTGDRDVYKYSKEDPESRTGWAEHQELQVKHTPTQAAYTHQDEQGGIRRLRGGPGAVPEDYGGGLRTERAAHDLRLNAHRGQQKLFGMAVDPGRSEVDYMAGSREGRTMSFTMLGIAHNRAMAERGRSLSAPTDLSEHSSKLVHHLRERGLAEGEGAPPITNNIQFQDWTQTHHMETGEKQLPHEEVMAGRHTSRQILRASKPKPEQSKPQYEQGTLF